MSTTNLVRPTRRTLVRGAAWSVPVISIAAAAPAFAASPCMTSFNYDLIWGTSTYNKSANVGTAAVAAPPASGATPVTVTFTSSFTGSPDRRASDNLTVPTVTNIGGLGAQERGLLISHGSTGNSRNNGRQSVTISFSRAVTGLNFVITDVDSANGAWWDRVELSPSPSTAAYNGAIVQGAGTAANPWQAINGNQQIATTSSNGNVAVTYAGSVTSITLDFWSSVSGGTQLIRLSDFDFNAMGC